MALRFNKEPVNLIHQIPLQNQIDEARPVPPPYGKILLHAGAICVRKARQFLAYVTRDEKKTPPPVRKPLALPDRTVEHRTTQQDHAGQTVQGTNVVQERSQEAENSQAARLTIFPESSATPIFVQAEEVAELKTFLAGQQEDIARLSTEIQELKALVVSQQQVLVCLGKELEAGAFSTTAARSAASSARRGPIVRKKPVVKDEPMPSQQNEGAPLNL